MKLIKKISAVFLIVLSSHAFADQDRCTQKEIASTLSYAKENTVLFGLLPSQVEVVHTKRGASSEAVGNNSGSDYVFLEETYEIPRELKEMSVYEVFYKQIGTTDDCDVLEVRQVI